MLNKVSQSLFSIQFTVSLQEYENCFGILTRQSRKNGIYRTIVLGILLSMVALWFVGFLLFRQRTDPVPYLLSAGLLACGVYNIVYYPLLYQKTATAIIRREYQKNKYFTQPTTLEFYPEYFIEISAKGNNRVMWQSVESVVKMPDLYVLRIAKHVGIILPISGVEQDTLTQLECYLEATTKLFGKEIVHMV